MELSRVEAAIADRHGLARSDAAALGAGDALTAALV